MAKKVLTILTEKYYTRLRKIAYWMNIQHRESLVQFLNRWNENRMKMEEEHGGYIPIEHTETTQMLTVEELEEDEVRPNSQLYKLDDKGWAKAPNGLVFGVFPKDLVDAT